jgi:hypothetical protein
MVKIADFTSWLQNTLFQILTLKPKTLSIIRKVKSTIAEHHNWNGSHNKKISNMLGILVFVKGAERR